ncbi:MraY family glycosyltransferase, partial [uncultured Clostridium sp.]
MKYLLAIIIAFSSVFILTPIFMKLAFKYNFTDKPTKRKQHKGETPICGGIAMFIGFFIAYFIVFYNYSFDEKYGIFIGSLLILIIGIIDDYYKSIGREFGITPRLAVQLLAAVIVFKSGISFEGFTNPFTHEYITLAPIVQFVLTITWIFGVTTVINWSDGMDGLAGSVSFISAITFAVSAIILGQPPSLLFSLITAGVVLAFLYYNKYPAKIFMGDSGANFLGFILSIIALDGAFKGATILSLMIPILALAVPIFDNIFVIFKRFSEGKPIYQADRSQIHYRLQEKGLNNKQ